MASVKIQLCGKFFTANLIPSSSADVKGAMAAVAPKRDSVMHVYLCGCMMKTVDYKKIYRVAAAVLWSNAECCSDVVLPNLSEAARELVPRTELRHERCH
jgi:hypothetical protein